eukprot:Nitzschia sp. Nitz4//scaffold86_size83305//56490//57620//NITZ4_005267-RA/size83305-processed-gene-0.106-mRNA-1//-1//CDS//3329559265//3089//frame0
MTHSSSTPFQATSSNEAKGLTDGVELCQKSLIESINDEPSKVIMPWVGYGTYKLGKQQTRRMTLEAIRQGYRMIDTAFIYAGETGEQEVGLAIQDAIDEGVIQRDDVFVQTKHWRTYHGYKPTMECLRLSLQRLQLDYIDSWLIHWPGPAWKPTPRTRSDVEQNGPWPYSVLSQDELPSLRSETWRAMEDALKAGLVRSIGVSNFSAAHLERLKTTARIWPPAVNQIEYHPLDPQPSLLSYCKEEGIVVQAYASLGGQDAGKNFWKKLYPLEVPPPNSLRTTPPVRALAQQTGRTPAQVLLRWALDNGVALVPKTSSMERMQENTKIFDFSLSETQRNTLELQLQEAVQAIGKDEDIEGLTRLCWRSDPLRMLDFD